MDIQHCAKCGTPFRSTAEACHSCGLEVEPNPIGVRQIDAILPFIEKFEQPGFTWFREGSDPSPVTGQPFSSGAMEFLEGLYDNDWVSLQLNWLKWKERAGSYIDCPEAIASADTETIRMLFTIYARQDRYSSGIWRRLFENGHVLALLRRLRDIRWAWYHETYYSEASQNTGIKMGVKTHSLVLGSVLLIGVECLKDEPEYSFDGSHCCKK